MVRGTVKAASLTSSDMWAAESEPDGSVSRVCTTREWRSGRTDAGVDGGNLADHESQTHGRPTAPVDELGKHYMAGVPWR